MYLLAEKQTILRYVLLHKWVGARVGCPPSSCTEREAEDYGSKMSKTSDLDSY